MSTASIARDLDRLADLGREIEQRRAFHQAKRDKLLKTVKPKLAAIDTAESQDLVGPLADYEQLKLSITAATIAAGESIKGQELQCVYYGPRAKWNDDMLQGMAANLPQILTARSETEPSAQIRKVAKPQENKSQSQ